MTEPQRRCELEGRRRSCEEERQEEWRDGPALVHEHRIRLEAIQQPPQAPQVPRNRDTDDSCEPLPCQPGFARRGEDVQIAAAINVQACSSVGLNKPGTRSSASPGWQSDALDAVVEVDFAGRDEEVEEAGLVEVEVVSVSQGGGVVGKVSELVRVEEGGEAMTVAELARVRVLTAVEVM